MAEVYRHTRLVQHKFTYVQPKLDDSIKILDNFGFNGNVVICLPNFVNCKVCVIRERCK